MEMRSVDAKEPLTSRLLERLFAAGVWLYWFLGGPLGGLLIVLVFLPAAIMGAVCLIAFVFTGHWLPASDGAGPCQTTYDARGPSCQ